MYNRFVIWISNTLYGVSAKINKVQALYPDQEIVVAGATKARKLEQDEDLSRNPRWITARRAVLILTDTSLHCGSWTINLEDIASAQLIRFKGTFSKGLLLKVETQSRNHYQFGLQHDPRWEAQSVFRVTLEDGTLKNTPFSIAARVVVVLWILYLLFKWFI